ncbi:hypothetical protein PG987_014737 [Apiospora arundinis]
MLTNIHKTALLGALLSSFFANIIEAAPSLDISNDALALNQDDITYTCLATYRSDPSIQRIHEGIKYLRSLGDRMCGDHGGSDGKSGCGRLSCSYNAAIKWCNMGTDYYETKCSAFADYAQDILNHCTGDGGWRVHGYEDDQTSDHHIRVRVEKHWC